MVSTGVLMIKYKSKMSWTFKRNRAIIKEDITSDVTLHRDMIYGTGLLEFQIKKERKKINKKERKIAKEF